MAPDLQTSDIRQSSQASALIIESDPERGGVLKNILTLLGVRSVTVLSEEDEACIDLARQKYDLIVLRLSDANFDGTLVLGKLFSDHLKSHLIVLHDNDVIWNAFQAQARVYDISVDASLPATFGLSELALSVRMALGQ